MPARRLWRGFALLTVTWETASVDARHFDALSRALSTGTPRRRLLALLAALPLLGGLAAILDPEDTEGAGRRKRRKKAHKHGKGRRRTHPRKKTCTAESVAQTCAGKCGSVQNNCKQPVDCGSCDCSPSCGECFTCQGAAGTRGTCVPQAAEVACGAPATCDSGTLFPQGSCDGNGHCLSVLEVPCDPYAQCDGNACATTCTTDDDCVGGAFCNGSGQCVEDRADGEACASNNQCASGFCVDGVCCDTACDGACQACNLSGSVGTCMTESDGTACGGPGTVCQGGSCVCPSGVTCCPSGQVLLPNDTCARPCSAETCAGCQGNVGCSGLTTDGIRVCNVSAGPCDARPVCNPANTTGCPQGQVCLADCGGSGPRCGVVAVCPAV